MKRSAPTSSHTISSHAIRIYSLEKRISGQREEWIFNTVFHRVGGHYIKEDNKHLPVVRYNERWHPLHSKEELEDLIERAKNDKNISVQILGRNALDSRIVHHIELLPWFDKEEKRFYYQVFS